MCLEMPDPSEEERPEPPTVLFGTCAWLSRKFGWSVHKTRLAVAFMAVLDPTFFVGLVYIVTGIILGDDPPD